MNSVIGGLVTIIAAINALVTRAVWRKDLYDRSQKIHQTIFIWVLPIAGTALAWYMLHADPPTRKNFSDALEHDPMGDGNIGAYWKDSQVDSDAGGGGDASSD